MKLIELSEAVGSNSLYHATKLPYCNDQLKHDELHAAMIHRFWKDGKRRERGEKGYEDHVWIKGLSLTRDLQFALKWGFLIYELDKTLLTQRYKLLPITWFSGRVSGGSKRREAEEYLWMETSKLSGDGREVIEYANNGKVRLKPLHKYCKKNYSFEIFHFSFKRICNSKSST